MTRFHSIKREFLWELRYALRRCHYCWRKARWFRFDAPFEACDTHHELLAATSTDDSWLFWERI